MLPPGPRPRVPGRLELAFWRDPLVTLERIAGRYGDVAGFTFGPDREILLTDPELIREVLVTRQRAFAKGRALQVTRRVIGNGLLTNEGDIHLRQRRLMQPLFGHRRIGEYAETMVACADRVQARWRDGEELDAHEEMARLTLTIVGRTVFAADVEGEASEIGEALTVSLEAVNRLIYPWGPVLERLPLPSTRRFLRARERLDATIFRLIEQRRAAPGGGDLLSLLLAAQDAEGGMSDEQVRDEAMTIFLAGHETTAVWLTWTWLLLARNPAAEARLHAELDEVLDGRLPTPDDLPALVYTERVLRESLRVYPPVWLLTRRALEDLELGGHRVPAGTSVLASQWLTHRDPRWWPDPLAFRPERWEEDGAARPSHAFFPFGAGTRVCIGEGFAWLEARLALATIASRWRLRPAPGAEVGLHPRITLRPRGGLPVVAQARVPGQAEG